MQEPPGQVLGVVAGAVAQQHRELVAAQPGRQVVRAHRGAQLLRDAGEQAVAGRVPEGVVDGLEPVQVDQHDRGAAGFAGGQRRGHLVVSREMQYRDENGIKLTPRCKA